jgi:hypothetical protein
MQLMTLFCASASALVHPQSQYAQIASRRLRSRDKNDAKWARIPSGNSFWNLSKALLAFSEGIAV